MEFSPYFRKVIGVDNDIAVIQDAEKNLALADIQNCELTVGDVRDEAVLSAVNANIVVYDIPHWSSHGGTVSEKNPKLDKLIESIRATITNAIAIYAPPHMTYEDVVELFDDFEYQQVWIANRYDRNIIYLGPLVEHNGVTKLQLK